MCSNHRLSIDTINARANLIWPVGPFRIFLIYYYLLSWKRLGLSNVYSEKKMLVPLSEILATKVYPGTV
jgi:hypothetical protein